VAESSNPYGAAPGSGLTMPSYFKPTPYITNNNSYVPGTEDLGPDEMRISFVGSAPWPPRIKQAGTSMMVELGNGDSFFFDMGNGSIKNILAMGVPPAEINDIFITHLHVDHYADLPYMIPFTAISGRFEPLRVHGPSGRTPELGFAAMMDHMLGMLQWNFEAFHAAPVGAGFDVEVNEFDFRDENAVCYDRNGVTVRHWPRSHQKDGASAFRLDWEKPGLSFVWTGDGRPDRLTIEYSQGADVFVTEVQADLGQLMAPKTGFPPEVYNFIIDTQHTPHYGAGYLFKEIDPRVAMVTHIVWDQGLVNEVTAGVRAHWPGLFLFGAPDVQVINVTKDAVWAREAVLPELGGIAQADLSKQFPDGIPEYIEMPQPRIKDRTENQDPYFQDIEIDPELYYPPDMLREMVLELPDPLRIPLRPPEDAA